MYTGPTGYAPATIRSAFSVDGISFTANGSTQAGDGTGQTIAILSYYNDPNIASDLAHFDSVLNIAPPPSLTIVNENGSTTGLPGNASTTLQFATDTAMAVEWAHAIAPNAKLLLVEMSNPSAISSLIAGLDTARSYPGVDQIALAFPGAAEASAPANVTSLNAHLTTPADHPGVTFVAPSGNTGGIPLGAPSPGVYSPAASPNVLSVGGTTFFSSGNSYSSESAWPQSSGGYSTVMTRPAYQAGFNAQAYRGVPDVSFDATASTNSPTGALEITGVTIYDSYDFGSTGGWNYVGGTEVGAAIWSGIIAIANQGRNVYGESALNTNGSDETQPLLNASGFYRSSNSTLAGIYRLPASDFHDIVSGTQANGPSAGPGWDAVTGRGTPVASSIVYGLASPGTVTGYVLSGGSAQSGVMVYLDLNANGVLDANEPSAVSMSSGQYVIGGVVAGTYAVREMVPGGYSQTGTTQYSAAVAFGAATTTGNFTNSAIGVTKQAVYFLSNRVNGDHLYTPDPNEYVTLGLQLATWEPAGIAYYDRNGPGAFSGVTTVPLYRLVNNATQLHMWTDSAAEYNSLLGQGWTTNGIAGYVLPTPAANTTTLYRLSLGAIHYWTTNQAEYNALDAGAWTGEGAACYVIVP